MTTTATGDDVRIGNLTFGDFRRRYANCVQAGVPVLGWEEFEELAAALLAASDDLRAAVGQVCAAQDLVIPPPAHAEDWNSRYVGFLGDVNEPTAELFDLTRSDCVPNYLHHADLDFKLVYGKSRRNPAAKMRRRLAELRKAAAFLRRRAAVLLPLCGSGWKGGEP